MGHVSNISLEASSLHGVFMLLHACIFKHLKIHSSITLVLVLSLHYLHYLRLPCRLFLRLHRSKIINYETHIYFNRMLLIMARMVGFRFPTEAGNISLPHIFQTVCLNQPPS
jgi:hypothetical protein